MNIPPSRLTHCTYCATDLDTTARGTWQYAHGWLPVNRYTGNKSGTNSLTLPKRDHQFACDECMHKLKHGIPTGQLSMLKLESDEHGIGDG